MKLYALSAHCSWSEDSLLLAIFDTRHKAENNMKELKGYKMDEHAPEAYMFIEEFTLNEKYKL